ncbi:GNAT family N-acetyltransferase [Aeromicrobium stalagmiti]|uniref:GNAT family N-acetyltransferase n=1 Tax=Aeromicrobium stalagmiti TaxID=2738988 RepID=UPI001568C83E|nr:GNAT family N-acetyltransferase [Aeromicrobium stalagmiti]NRQ51714.1 GNAT family N-acetyltransferase [Aeromicrobium stalagmiti]
MIFSSPDPASDPYFADTLLTLQRSSYALEAELIGDDRIPPLHEGQGELSAWRGRWITAWDGVDLVGAVAWSDHGDHVDVAKVMVSPAAMRRGIASALLGRVLEASAGRQVVVATGRDNAPAVSLYAKLGFAREADEQVPPGIWVTRFRLGA